MRYLKHELPRVFQPIKLVKPSPKRFNPNIKCEYPINSRGYPIDDCKYFKEKVQGLITAKLLTFKKSDPEVDILINRPDNVQRKRFPETLVIPYLNEDSEMRKTNATNVPRASGSAQNNLVFAARKAKKVVLGSLSKEKIQNLASGSHPLRHNLLIHL